MEKICYSNRLKSNYKLVVHTAEHWRGIPYPPLTVNPLLWCPNSMGALKVLVSDFFIFLIVKNLLNLYSKPMAPTKILKSYCAVIDSKKSIPRSPCREFVPQLENHVVPCSQMRLRGVGSMASFLSCHRDCCWWTFHCWGLCLCQVAIAWNFFVSQTLTKFLLLQLFVIFIVSTKRNLKDNFLINLTCFKKIFETQY